MSKVHFSGNQISLRDLKDQIIKIKKLKSGRADWNFDLVVKDSEDPSKGAGVYVELNYHEMNS